MSVLHKPVYSDSEREYSYEIWKAGNMLGTNCLNNSPVLLRCNLAYDSVPVYPYIGKWALLTSVYESDTLRFYINGVSISTMYGADDSKYKPDVIYDDSEFIIGASNSDADIIMDYGWVGYIDDVRLYNRALDPIEINAIYYGITYEFSYDTITILEQEYIDTTYVNEISYDTVEIEVNKYVTVSDTLVIPLFVNGIPQVPDVTIKVYPNPTSGILHIDLDDVSDVMGYTIRIIGTSGNVIFQEVCTQEEFDINMLDFTSRGVYILDVYDELFNQVSTKRIIVN